MLTTFTETQWEENAIHISETEACLEGHFPHQPVVPSVHIITLALDKISARYPNLQLVKIRRTKFLAPIIPPASITFEFTINPKLHCHFRCKDATTLYCEAKLELALVDTQ